MIVAKVVEQHADEACALYRARMALCVAPHGSLACLRRFDDRLDAHLSGLAIAGEHGSRLCEAALEVPSTGAIFTAAIGAVREKQHDRFTRLLAVANAIPSLRPALASALGWAERDTLQGVVVRLLGGPPFERMLGIAACGLHRVDPGAVHRHYLQDPDAQVRARALKVAGEVGCLDLASACESAIGDGDPGCRAWSAWSSVMLGKRGRALDALTGIGLQSDPARARAFALSLQALGTPAGHRVLERLAAQPNDRRWLVQGSGVVGDPAYVSWLITQMAQPETARVAGEAFSLITGADLEALEFECSPPDGFTITPNDDPEDSNVDMDVDDGLPWPDPTRIQIWWEANGSRFQNGHRYFVGAPVTREHCIEVLKTGYQRQRILAANYLCLLDPGTPLFNTSAPAWRQQKLLAQM
jgi:uncharacterized protein (TIGR02270 family)